MSQSTGSGFREGGVMEEDDLLCGPLMGKMRHVQRDMNILNHCVSSSP